MEDKIEVGEYVRTDKGNIGMVINTRLPEVVETGEIITKYILDTGEWTTKKYIVKNSKNIIDLIEDDDIVNGMMVEKNDDELGFPIYTDSLMDCIEEFRPLDTIKIKTILTHEQYEANCYRLED